MPNRAEMDFPDYSESSIPSGRSSFFSNEPSGSFLHSSLIFPRGVGHTMLPLSSMKSGLKDTFLHAGAVCLIPPSMRGIRKSGCALHA